MVVCIDPKIKHGAPDFMPWIDSMWFLGRTHATRLYLSPILDRFNGEIISYRLHQRPAFSMVMDMVKDGLSRLKPNEQPIFHSDQGWQYQMQK